MQTLKTSTDRLTDKIKASRIDYKWKIIIVIISSTDLISRRTASKYLRENQTNLMK